MDTKIKVFLVDDDVNICELVKIYLNKEGYRVDIAYDGGKALEYLKSFKPDIILLDVMLPTMDGFQLCKEIRKMSSVPVIMLTAKGETLDKVMGLEIGADDYIVKPFDPNELVARVKAVLRRYGTGKTDSKEVRYPNLIVSLSDYTVEYEGKVLELTPRELELLYFLASNPGKVYTREQLIEQLWGYDFFGDSRTVDVHIKRLREKLEIKEQPWKIRTVWGVGYKFEVK